jgi:hypothetical protein
MLLWQDFIHALRSVYHESYCQYVSQLFALSPRYLLFEELQVLLAGPITANFVI